MAPARGTTLALLGVCLFVVTMVAGAATAPDRSPAGSGLDTPTPTPVDTPAGSGTDAGTPADGTATPDGTVTPRAPRTLVGVQGGWVTHGNLRLYSHTAEVWRATDADGYFEATMLDDGTVLAAFANETSTDCGDLSAPCARTGYRHVDPSGPDGPAVVAEYSFPVASITNSEVHAVDRVREDTYVFTDMDEERVVLVRNDSVVWEWRAASFYDAPADPASRDWLHINDVDSLGDGRFLVSVRNANQILVVERGEGVVEVVNTDDGGDDSSCLQDGRLEDFDGDGDVRCGDPDVFKEQHNPQWVGPGAVLVADSDNDRVVEVRETDDGNWEVAWVVREADGRELHWPRDADRLPNGNTLITDSLNKRVVEVDPNGTAVWSVDTSGPDGPHIPYEADRLPYGEFAGRFSDPSSPTPGNDTGNVTTATPTPRGVTDLPTAVRAGDVDGGTGGEVPFLTLAVVGMRGTFAWFPLWFSELHLAVTILSAVLVVAGGADTLRQSGALGRLRDRL
ncbi:MAG: arylsulfotransferase family protein [Haloarculaceae archaeon]